jgi:LPXTG-motif cell wall-anchored protein
MVPSNFKLQATDLEADQVAQTGVEGNSLLLVSMLVTGAVLLLVVFKKKAA